MNENIESIANENITFEVTSVPEKTLQENLESGLKIMGVGMAAVFGVLAILYFSIKIMGCFVKGKNNEENR